MSRFLGLVATMLLGVAPAWSLTVEPLVQFPRGIIAQHDGETIKVIPYPAVGTTVKSNPGFYDAELVRTVKIEGAAYETTVFAVPGWYLVIADNDAAFVNVVSKTPTPVPPGPTPPGPSPVPPEPEPNPTPDRDCSSVPEDDYDNAGRFACRSLALVEGPAIKLMPKMRNAYLATVQAIEQPDVSQVLEIGDAIRYFREATDKALGSDVAAWDRWGEAVDEHMYKQGITTKQGLKAFLKAVAEGLK